MSKQDAENLCIAGDQNLETMKDNAKSWVALLEASTWDFPVAIQKWLLGQKEGSQEIEDVALKAYHAWVSMANESVDRFYQTKGFCELMTGSLNWLLQWQRLGRSMADTMTPRAMSGSRGGPEGDDRVVDQTVGLLGREVRQLKARLNMLEGRNAFRAGLKVAGDNDSASR